MLISFFDRRNIIHKEFLSTEMTVNAAFYTQALIPLQNHVTAARLAVAKSWKLRHDNVLCHGAIVIQHLLAKIGMATSPHTLYCPNLVPLDFFLFTRIKRSLKEHQGGSSGNDKDSQGNLERAFDE